MIYKNLNNIEIDETIRRLEIFMDEYGVSPKMKRSFLLLFEEIFLCIKKLYPDAQFSLKIRKGLFLASSVRAEVKCDEYDVLRSESKIIKKLLRHTKEYMSFDYQNGCNIFECAPPSYNAFRHNLRITWKYMKPFKGKLILCTAFQVISLIMEIAMPLVAAKVVVQFYNSAPVQIVLMSVIYCIMEIFNESAFFYCNLGFEKIYKDMLAKIEIVLAENLMKTRIATFEEAGSGLFIQRMTTDIRQLTNGFVDAINNLGTMLTILGKMLSLLVLSPVAFLFVLAEMIPQSLLEKKRIRLVNEKDTVFRSSSDRFSGMVGEMIHGAKDIRLLRSEDTFIEKLRDVYEESNEASFDMKFSVRKYRLLRRCCNAVTKLFYTALLGYLLWKGKLAAAVAIILYNYRFELSHIPWYVGEFVSTIKSFNLTSGRVFSLSEGNDFPKESFGDIKKKINRGKIELCDVSFSYSNVPVIKKLSLCINSGEMVAIVGKSGCGKSTLLNLITKLYDPQKGKIFIDDTDISTLDAASLRNSVTIVSQLPYLFNMSVRENLLLVKPDASQEELFEACRKAYIHEDIMDMKDGYDTILGEGGITISGGQRQRIAIARMFLRNSPILLLDEATSALDNISQSAIQDSLEELNKRHTVVIVAHRLSTIVNCDRIIYMENGCIIAEGTHQQLLENCEQYAELYKREGASLADDK